MHIQWILSFMLLLVALIAVAEAKYKTRHSGKSARIQRDIPQHLRIYPFPNRRFGGSMRPNRRLGGSMRPTVRFPRPKFQIPDIRIPEVRVPAIQLPDVQVPNIRIPDVKVPDIRIPDVQLPNIRLPDVQVPNIRIPEVTVPDIRIPNVNIPKIHVADIHDHVPQVEASGDFDSTFRRLPDWLRRLIPNERFRTSFSSPNDRDWKLTWGWFNDPFSGTRLGPEPNVRPGSVYRSWPSKRPTFPRPGLSSPFFPSHHHRPQDPLSRPPHPVQPNHHQRPNTHQRPRVLCRGRHYSARRYESSTWVSIAVLNGTSMDALRRIKQYFDGENDQGRVMSMSRPLRMTVTGVNGTISDTEDTLEEFRLSAMVPRDGQRAPPAPTDPLLSITYEPRQVYFATHFRLDRRPGTPAIYDEFFELQDALELAGESFEPAVYHTAFYETWTEMASGSTRPQPGEILIPAASGENLVCTRQETPGPQNGIEQCGNSRCPTYEHLAQLRDDVELRRIEGGTYITRRAPACTIVLPAFVSHCSLKRYLKGANSEGERYPSPAPFIHYVFPSHRATSFCKQTSISAYMLPSNITAAEPTQRDLRIRTIPDRDAFVIKFGGRPNARIVESKVDELREFLRQQGLCFERDKYAVAVYDHPFNRPPHLNEVIVFKKNGPCRDSEFDETMAEGVPASTTSRMTTESLRTTTESPRTTTESPRTDGMFFEEDFESSTEALDKKTTLGRMTPESTRMSTRQTTTELSPLIEVNLTLESNSVELERDLIPYRFSGNQTDFPEDFPVDIFVF